MTQHKLTSSFLTLGIFHYTHYPSHDQRWKKSCTVEILSSLLLKLGFILLGHDLEGLLIVTLHQKKLIIKLT